MNQRRLHPAEWIALLLFALMLIGSYARLFISVGLVGYMDESYWVASSLLSSLGGRPYFNELFIQQTAALLYEPLVSIYYKLFGNFALMLFVRHLYFLLSLMGSFLFFRFFRLRTDFITALAIASLPLVGSFWGEPSLGYNAIGGICFGAGALLALRGVEFNSKKLCAWSGVLFFFAVAAYPTLVAGLVLLWLLIAACGFYLKRPFLKYLLIANAMTALGLALFVGSLIWREGFENLILVYRFSTAHSSMGSLFGKINYGFFLMLAFAPPLWVLIPAFLLWVALWRWKGISWHFFAIPLCVWMTWQQPPEEAPFYPALYMLLVFSALPLIYQALRTDFTKAWPELLLWAAALGSTILTCWSSALTIYATSVTSTYCLVAVFALARPRKSRWFALLAFVIPLTVFWHKMILHQLDDSKVSTEAEMFSGGALAGIWTSVDRFHFLESVQNDLDEGRKNARTVLFYNEFPLGYLLSPLQPATRTMFLHSLRESGPPIQTFFREYYFDPANRPDVIFRFKYFMVDGVKYSVEPEQYKPAEDVFWNYLPSENEYELFRDRDSYSVFRKKSLPR